MRITI